MLYLVKIFTMYIIDVYVRKLLTNLVNLLTALVP
jgi:hypothetical protein